MPHQQMSLFIIGVSCKLLFVPHRINAIEYSEEPETIKLSLTIFFS